MECGRIGPHGPGAHWCVEEALRTGPGSVLDPFIEGSSAGDLTIRRDFAIPTHVQVKSYTSSVGYFFIFFYYFDNL